MCVSGEEYWCGVVSERCSDESKGKNLKSPQTGAVEQL